jgi:predicted 3-demethylubiquinone-9 3-methyltransferase (glyoxalase superfamily)
MPHKVSTCLWYDDNAEEAVNFYVSLIPDSRVTVVTRYGQDAPMPEGTALTVVFQLAGVEYMGLNGGPIFPQSEAASIVVQCDAQDEIDHLWNALTARGGKESRCGWLKDRFGVSWQIVPSRIGEWMTSPDREASNRALAAIMQMGKIDIATVERAFGGA